MLKPQNDKELKESLVSYKKKLKNETLTTQAYLTIRHAIKHLELQPGESFLEREISDMLEMSRTPVHSALIRLEMDGWLEVIPRKGFTVSPIKAQTIYEISQISETLDGLAVELALPNLSEDQLMYLKKLINDQEDSLIENDFEKYVEIDDTFHYFISIHSQNNVLNDFLETYSDQLYRARLYTIDDRKFPKQSIDEHRAILSALVAKNGTAARSLMETHRRRGNEEIVEIIKNKETVR